MPEVGKLRQGSGTLKLLHSLSSPGQPCPLFFSNSLCLRSWSLAISLYWPLSLSSGVLPSLLSLHLSPGMTSCSLAGGHLPSAPQPLICSCSSLTCCLSGPQDPLLHHLLPEMGPSPGPGPRHIVHHAREPCPRSSPFWMASLGLTQMMYSQSPRAAVASTLSACGRRPAVGQAGAAVRLPGSPLLRLQPPTLIHPIPSMRRCPLPACCRSSAHAVPR